MLNITSIIKNIIYGLADSRNDLIYYIGKTSIGKRRPLQHLTNSHSLEVNNWIKLVKEEWGDIKIIVIEEVEDLSLLSDREKYWIGYYLEINNKLLNKKDFPLITNNYSNNDDEKYSNLKSYISFAGDIIKKKRRLVLNITQSDLAKASKVSRSTVSIIESNGNWNHISLQKVLLGLSGLEINNKIIDSKVGERAHKRTN